MLSAISNTATPQPAPAPLKRDGDGVGDRDDVHGTRGVRGITTRAVAMNATDSTSTDLKIVTQEGDVVTLHASQDASVTYTNVRSRGPNSRASFTSLEATNSQSLSFSVQGDLSASELKDIETLVKRVGGDIQSFLKGGPGTTGKELSGLDALSGFTLDFQHTETTTVATLVRRVPVQPAVADGSSSAKPAPMPVPVSAPASGEPDASATTVTTPALPAPAASTRASDLLRRMLEAGRESGMSFERTTRALGHVFHGLTKSPGLEKQNDLLESLRSALREALRGGDLAAPTSIETTDTAASITPASTTPASPSDTPDPSESPANAAPLGV